MPSKLSKDLLLAILDGVADPVFVKDRDHRWIYANRAFCDFIGLRREQVIGFTDADYFPAEQCAVFYAKDDETFARGGVVENEEELQDADGGTRVISTKKTVIRDPERGEVLVGIIRDLTALRSAQAALLETQRAEMHADEANIAKSRFLTNMSHELRTPLNAIVGYAEMLDEEAAEGGSREFIGHILSASSLLVEMIDQILDLSRIEAGVADLSREEIELRGVLDEVAHTLAPTASQRSSTLGIEAGGPGRVVSNRSAVLRVVLNLTENALKYASPGTVVLKLWSNADSWFIDVIDDGPGVRADQVPHLFEKFWRAAPEGRAPGTGLGLSICRELTEELGGSLTHIHGDPGAIFRLRLPSAGEVVPGPTAR